MRKIVRKGWAGGPGVGEEQGGSRARAMANHLPREFCSQSLPRDSTLQRQRREAGRGAEEGPAVNKQQNGTRSSVGWVFQTQLFSRQLS